MTDNRQFVSEPGMAILQSLNDFGSGTHSQIKNGADLPPKTTMFELNKLAKLGFVKRSRKTSRWSLTPDGKGLFNGKRVSRKDFVASNSKRYEPGVEKRLAADRKWQRENNLTPDFID